MSKFQFILTYCVVTTTIFAITITRFNLPIYSGYLGILNGFIGYYITEKVYGKDKKDETEDN